MKNFRLFIVFILIFFISILTPFAVYGQISPATRPHTHSGGSSGGSTLSPATLNISGTLTAPTITASSTVTTPTIGSTGTLTIQTNGDLILAPNTAITNVTGSFTSTKACAANYTRTLPNFCASTPQASQVWVDVAACTQRTFTNALPADAKAVYLLLQWQALSNNAIATRVNSVSLFANGTCSGANQASSQFRVQEFAATVAGTSIGEFTDHLIAPLCATNTVCATQLNAGGNGNADVGVYSAAGYFD